MMTAYFIFKEDADSVTNSFTKFNSTFRELTSAYKDVTGEALRIGDSEVMKSSRELQASLSEDFKRFVIN